MQANSPGSSTRGIPARELSAEKLAADAPRGLDAPQAGEAEALASAGAGAPA